MTKNRARSRLTIVLKILAVIVVLLATSCSKQGDSAVTEPSLGTPGKLTETTSPSVVAKASLALKSADGEVWSIGRVIEKETLDLRNTSITTSEFGIDFGPIDGYDKGNLILGWNNRNRLIYVETASSDVKTVDGLGVGSKKADVLSRLGKPILETEKMLRYQNTETELVGILFYLGADGLVSKMVLFSYV